ncbi:SubName: Full=Uncharacterized protein {ECO:0000313/EMBL:CCA75519.1} [Serendipita indica DSM 11827]|nr:SubName: Full=Uncharacterized protein {ECO:0000313/EMBL:CCA75519.1} [Serendipita indica DSM 11827]
MSAPGTTPGPAAHMMVPPGGIPNNTDLILSAVFIPLFLGIGLYFHFRIFHAYGKKFIWSILCFGFCMARIAALSLRIAVVKHVTDKTLNIIAQVFIAAGVVLLFFVNLQMSRRFFGQIHPHHASWVRIFVNFFAVLIIPVLAMVITTVVQSFLTTDAHILSIDRKVRLVASVFLVILAFLPIPIVLLVLILKALAPGGLDKPEPLAEGDADPEADADARLEKERILHANGTKPNPEAKETAKGGHMSGKVSKVTNQPLARGEPKTGFGPTPVGKKEILETALFIIIPGVLLTFEQGVRCAQAFHVPKFGEKTPWYMTKAAFWVCIFGFEIISVFILYHV